MWDEVLGHEQNKNFLAGLLTGQRSTASLLFSGPEGVGKKMLARAFSASFLCQNDPLRQDDCASCRAMAAGTHPDFIQVAPLAAGKELLLEQIKEMARQAAYAPTLSPYKVCLIDGADYMKAPAANSLLKLLEEPPPYWLFILIATDANKLLPTILSRVMERPFRGLAVEDITQILTAHQVQQPQVLASLADGSPGKALAYADMDALLWRERAFYLVEQVGSERVMEFLGQQEWLEKINQPDGLLLLEMLTLIFRDGLLNKEQIPCSYYNEDSLLRIKACFSSWTSTALEKALVWTQNSARAVGGYSGAKAVLEALLLRLNGLRREK